MSNELNSQSHMIAMMIIANSGEAKSLAFQALSVLRETRDYEEIASLLEEAREHAKTAHQYQTELITMTAKGEKVDIDVLLIHSQDHLMTTMLAIELIEEMVMLYKNH